MESKKRKVVWDLEALKYFKASIDYIKKDSLQNAEKVKAAIIASTNQLGDSPFIHPVDKFKLGHDKSYRAYELFKLRIAYHVTDDRITIVRMRHVKMEPKDY